MAVFRPVSPFCHRQGLLLDVGRAQCVSVMLLKGAPQWHREL